MELRVLGPVTVVADDGHEHVLGVTREAALLADLVVHAGEVMSASRLIDDLWRGAPTAGAGATLQTYVKNLRRLLAGASSAAAVCVVRTVRPGYVAELHPDVVDAFRAERMIAEGRRAVYGGDAAEGMRHLSGAVALWRGPAFGELRGEAYVQAEAARLDELRLGALEALIDAELALGRHVEAAGRLDALVAEHPYRERFWAQLMLALARSGRQAEALRAYQRVRRLLGDDLGLEPGAELRDLEQAILLGEATLGSAAVAAGELAIAGAPRTQRRRFDLPPPLTRFVGRATERRAIAQQLTASRLVTLTGMGGVGKTRLALEVAADVQDDYADGVWLFELAPARSETAVLAAVTAAFGLTVSELAPPVEQICRYLAGRHALLLFDNCEHVLDAVAGLVETILRDAQGVRVLATSRELLRLPGEVTVAVPPLAVPDESTSTPADVAATEAVELFCDRAREARSEFALTEDDAPAVAEICRRLEGIPLALELAAARLRMLSVGQVAARLGDCFALLTGGARTAAPRQQALRATLDWSYDMLSGAEQAALRSLSVFPDRFDIDAAFGVIGGGSGQGDANGLELVGQLVDKSFVVAERGGDEVRYRLLEPVRQYAAEKLSAAGENQQARRRHRDVFVDRAPSMARDLREVVSFRLVGDDANFLAALEWSWQEGDSEAALILVVVANSRVFGGEIEGRRQWLERVLARPEPAKHPARVHAEVVLAQVINESGQPDPTRSRQLVDHALDLARRLRDPLLVAWTQFGAAELEVGWGLTGEGVAGLRSAAEVFEAHGLPVSAGWCHERLGWAAVGAGDHQAARTDFERAVELAGHGSGSPWLVLHALAALAPIALLAGDRRQGLQASDDALAMARRIGLRSGLNMALARSAETAILAGSYAEATLLLDELLGLLRDQASRRWVADTIELVMLVLEAQALNDEAAELLAASARMRAEAGEQIGGTRIVAQAVQATSDRLPPPSEPADPQRPQEPGSPHAVIVRAEELLRSAQRTSHRP